MVHEVGEQKAEHQPALGVQNSMLYVSKFVQPCEENEQTPNATFRVYLCCIPHFSLAFPSQAPWHAATAQGAMALWYSKLGCKSFNHVGWNFANMHAYISCDSLVKVAHCLNCCLQLLENDLLKKENELLHSFVSRHNHQQKAAGLLTDEQIAKAESKARKAEPGLLSGNGAGGAGARLLADCACNRLCKPIRAGLSRVCRCTSFQPSTLIHTICQ